MKLFQWRFIRGSWLALALTASALTASVAVAADLPALPQGLSAPSSAMNLPVFTLPTANGGSVRAEDFKGKVIIARFWATW